MIKQAYFAYGINIIKQRVRNQCPGSKLRGKAVLEGYRFLINSRGMATIAKNVSSTVYGLLWDITPEDERLLDWYEGVNDGHTVKKQVRIKTESNEDKSVIALAYVSAVSTPGRSREGYISSITDALERYEFPKEYVLELKQWSELETETNRSD